MRNRVGGRPSRGCVWIMLALVAGSTLVNQGCSSIPRRLAPPQPQLLQISLVQASFEGQRFAVSLLLVNSNAVAIPVRQLEFDVRLAGEGRLMGGSSVPFTLPPQGSETLELVVFSDTVSSVSRLMSLAQGPENLLDYEIHGTLTLDVRLREPLGFYHRGQVPLDARR